MTPEEASADSSSTSSGATSSVAGRSSGRGRYSRGRRRPRRSSNQPRRLPVSSDAPVESGVSTESEAAREVERAREPLPGPFQPAKVESIQAAIEKVTAIIGDLRDALSDMELVLEYLEDAERQQIADEREIESLQQRLNSMHRRGDRHQPQQRPSHRSHEENAQTED